MQERSQNGQYSHEWATITEGDEYGPMTSIGLRYWGTICFHCGTANDLEPGEQISAAEKKAFVSRVKEAKTRGPGPQLY